MNCPVCNVELRMADRQGVEIDYCPQCRGVWLDRGELDKIIERSATMEMQAPREEFRPPAGDYERREYREREHREHDYRYGDPRYKKKKSFLGEMFDFD